jgi:hypothetical protein
VFEYKVLRRIFGPKRDEGSEGFRKPRNQELLDFYSSQVIIRMTKSRRMRLVGQVAKWREEKYI